MATPLVAGTAALVREYYTRTHGIEPSAALVKATLANGAQELAPGQYGSTVPSWQIETVDSEVNAGPSSHCSLALDAAGHPHICYLDGTDEDLMYAWHDGST